MELEDIQLQAEIVKTKLCVFESELNDRVKSLQREVERLRAVRAQVSEMIANDDNLRNLLHAVNDYDAESFSVPDTNKQALDPMNNDLMLGLLEPVILKDDDVPDGNKMECGEHAESEPPKLGDYSSVNDGDALQDCHVKIVKVTNVYKVAYLKHYIKQKRFRRASKRALLKKKMESIREMFEEWQKKLSMVINSKLTVLNLDQSIDMASQEAMGDYSKPCDNSDSDPDMRNNDSMFFDEFRVRHEHQDTGLAREYYDFGDMMYPPYTQQYDCFMSYGKHYNMLPIREETCSQMAIDEITSETADEDCRDNVAI